MDLTPEQLQQLYQQYLSGNYSGTGGYSPSYVQSSGEDGATPSQFLGYDNQTNYFAPSGQDMGKITYGDPYELLKAAAFLGSFAVGGSALGAMAGGAGGMFGAGAGLAADGAGGMSLAEGAYPASITAGDAGALGGAGGFAGDATAAGYDPAYGAYSGGGGYAGDATAAGYDPAYGATGATGATGGSTPSYLEGTSAGMTAPAGMGSTAGTTAGATAGTGLLGGSGSSLLGSAGSLLAPVLGGLAGSKGVQSTQTQKLDPRLDGAVYGAGGVVPSAQSLMTSQLPQAQAAGTQMMGVGSGLLGQPIAGNGVGQVTLNSPTTATNPYLTGMADDIARRTQLMLGQNNNAIRGNFVGVGGLGGSRQGIAQGTAAGQAADSLQGQLAGLYGQAYNQDQNRALQQYGLDQNFYGQQRQQDFTGAGLGSDLMTSGLNAGWAPIKNAANAYSPFSGVGSTTQQQGGGGLGILGGALGGAQLYKAISSPSSTSGSSTSWWG